MVAPVMCSALRDPQAFAGAGELPSLVDAMRITLAERTRVAQHILDELLQRLPAWQPPDDGGGWRAVEATSDRLLVSGLRKREIVGAVLPQALADRVRRVRKLAQARVRCLDFRALAAS